MGTVTRYPQRVPRAKYEPPDDLDGEISDAVALHQRSQEGIDEAKRRFVTFADRKVPISYLADRLGVTRKTMYRLLGRKMP